MKAALLALSLLGQSPLQISDRVPVVDIETLCSDVLADDKAVAQEQAVLKFLNGDMMRQWAEAVLGI